MQQRLRSEPTEFIQEERRQRQAHEAVEFRSGRGLGARVQCARASPVDLAASRAPAYGGRPREGGACLLGSSRARGIVGQWRSWLCVGGLELDGWAVESQPLQGTLSEETVVGSQCSSAPVGAAEAWFLFVCFISCPSVPACLCVFLCV